jgi:hypothetical protein
MVVMPKNMYTNSSYTRVYYRVQSWMQPDMATKQWEFLRSNMIIRLSSQSQFNDFVDNTRFFFYVYSSLQPEGDSVNSSRDVLMCRKKKWLLINDYVSLPFNSQICDFCRGTLYIYHTISLRLWVSGVTQSVTVWLHLEAISNHMPSYCSGYDQLTAHLTDSCRLREVTDALNVVLYIQNVPWYFSSTDPFVVHTVLEPTQNSRYSD